MPRLRAAAGVAALLLVLACAGSAQGQSSRDTQRKLDQAQRELKAISAERRKLEGQRGSASRDLRTLDERLAGASRALHDTEVQLAAQRAELAKLQQKRDTLDASLAAQKRQLVALLRSAYTLGDDAPLKLLLSQDSAAEANRLLTWHRYLQRDRARRVATLTTELQALETLEAQIAERQRELDATRERQRTQLAALQGERKDRAQAVKQLEARYEDKRSREKALGSDVASLKKLLSQLRAAAARAEAERRAAAERAKREAARTGAPPPKVTPPPAGTGLRVGGVGWPLSGNLVAGFGGKLPDGGSSSGLLIGAAAGTPVKAVADGQVVFGDWMNGYGLILIVDHGNGYMSLYAHNEALLRDVGDRVKRGDPVASVGNSGSAGPPALYFELRRNGDPVNPNVWLKK